MERSLRNESARPRELPAMTATNPARRNPEDIIMTKQTKSFSEDLYDADPPIDLAADEDSSRSTGGGGADDALGLYLKQMGAIPLLNREKELLLATRLEIARRRYRRAILFSWLSIKRVVGMFERIHAGQLPIDPSTGKMVDGDIGTKTQQILKNVAALAKEAGTDLTKTLKTTIFLTDLGDFQAVNSAYGSSFPEAPPARSTVQVAALPLGSNIEIEFILAR